MCYLYCCFCCSTLPLPACFFLSALWPISLSAGRLCDIDDIGVAVHGVHLARDSRSSGGGQAETTGPGEGNAITRALLLPLAAARELGLGLPLLDGRHVGLLARHCECQVPNLKDQSVNAKLVLELHRHIIVRRLTLIIVFVHKRHLICTYPTSKYNNNLNNNITTTTTQLYNNNINFTRTITTAIPEQMLPVLLLYCY